MEHSIFHFWIGTVVFVGTYVLIASEKVHKTVAALLGAMLMLFVILPGPGHSAAEPPPSVDQAVAEKHVPLETDDGTARRQTAQINATEQSGNSMPAMDGSSGETVRHAELYSKLDMFARYANFDVVFTLAGMMLLVNLLSGTGLFQFVAIRCAKLARGLPIRTMILLVLATAFLSAFLDNVTTILLVAPVTLLVCNELGVPPVPFLMAETMASNVGGTATLIGDPPNLIIGSIAGLNFADFLFNLAPFIVFVMAVYCVCLWAYYSKRMHVTVEKRALIMELDERAAITDWNNLRRGGIVMILTIFGFLIHGALGLQPSVIAMSGATLALLICKVDVDHALEKIEWSTLFFFMALFILVCGAESCGLMEKIGGLVSRMGDWPVPVVVLILMWVSATAAAVMNNVSFTAAMVTVVAAFISSTPAFSHNAECRNLLWWGLALAVCLGGNASLVGAAANLVTVGIAEKNGHPVSFLDFLKYGLPMTIGSMLLASVYILARYYAVCTP